VSSLAYLKVVGEAHEPALAYSRGRDPSRFVEAADFCIRSAKEDSTAEPVALSDLDIRRHHKLMLLP
jgi:hypothetical protein